MARPDKARSESWAGVENRAGAENSGGLPLREQKKTRSAPPQQRTRSVPCSGQGQALEQKKTCSQCGQENLEWFNPFTLRWIAIEDVCHDCRVLLTRGRQEAIAGRWRAALSGRIDKVLRSCGVPQRYLMADISSVNREIADIVQTVLPNQGGSAPRFSQNYGGLYIFGRPGSGKTYLAAAIVKAYLLMLRPYFRDCYSEAPIAPTYPIFTIASDMLLEIRKTFNNPELSRNDIYDKYCNSPLVVIDDFMADKVTQWSVQTMYTIINRRYINNMPLVIISNHGLGEVERCFNAVSEFTGTSVVCRISEMGKVLILKKGSLPPQQHTNGATIAVVNPNDKAGGK
ncbi:IstB domain-containing protein ATP-binding protein [Candidatus Magnetobacterium bavaricum]|uniref:IstB domain-containing protein ATP-binding protein n=1 Tax=Candidatus Magnetobacterium bavaricum TaxID=29290 RepID=A0A0F3GQE1_9BACT|nr:IstB domain-containing protein ATP-binding protein [Candidatus Magnetobacterium bavaricum]